MVILSSNGGQFGRSQPMLTPEQLISYEEIANSSGQRIIQPRLHPILDEFLQACNAGRIDVVAEILSHITLNPPDRIAPTARQQLATGLERAVTRQHFSVIKLLLRHGFLPYALSWAGVDAAFKSTDITSLAVFIDAGWDVNEAGPGKTMRPLLRHAVTPEHAATRALLLRRGASPHTENERRLTPLETAVQWASLETVQEMLEFGGGAEDDALIAAVEVGNIAVAELLLAGGADVNRSEKELPEPWGRAQEKLRTPLDAALLAGQKSMAVWLFQHGATVRNYE